MLMFTTGNNEGDDDDEDNNNDDDDNDDDNDNKETKKYIGHNLRWIWSLAGRPPNRSGEKGSAGKRKSGQGMIRDAAAGIRRRATSRPHPQAEAVELGPG